MIVVSSRAPVLALRSLNHDETQQGKFITIYPSSDEQAVAIAQEVETALSAYNAQHSTQPLTGPAVPTDKAYGTSGLVLYRYASTGDYFVRPDAL